MLGTQAWPAVDPPADLDTAELLGLYGDMVLLRAFDDQALAYHHQGRLGTYAIYRGHEALQVGAARALGPTDWIFPSYRESAIGLVREMPITTVLSWWRGEPAGCWNPHDQGVANICVPIGTHLPHAVGFAWGARMRSEPTCALAFFGDGATSEGTFHEGLTFAGVLRAPVVFLCNNNGWAISTPVSAQTAAAQLADKAVGYGIPAERVDGADVLAVHAATRRAVERARRGDGPTFIEAVTYRIAPHATADDPGKYWDEERVAAERENECLVRYERRLREWGLLTEADAGMIRQRAVERVRAAMAEVETAPRATPETIFDPVYAAPPPGLAGQRDEVERRWR